MNDYREPEVSEATKVLATEFGKQQHYLDAQREHTEKRLRMRQQQEMPIHVRALDDNSAMINEIKALRSDRRELQNLCAIKELNLRETRVSLQRMMQYSRLSPTKQKSCGPIITKKQKPVLLPPIVPMVSSSNQKPCWGDVKLSKKVRKESGRARLQQLIDQLDSNSDKMRSQQKEINSLRSIVQELLGKEEAKLLHALSSPVLHVGESFFDTDALRNAPPPPVSQLGYLPTPTPGLERSAEESPDWTSSHHMPEALGGRPMTPISKPPL